MMTETSEHAQRLPECRLMEPPVGGLRQACYTAQVETKWLEDFVSLAETRSFSRSAQLRHVTQPAFSRRIQALEAWVGTDLVDRSSYPTSLTPAGETFYAQALEILGALQTTRNMMRGLRSSSQDMIEFAAPHTLAFTFFPHWIMDLRQDFGVVKSRLNAANVHDAVMRLTESSCDLLMAYHHASQPLQLSPEKYEMLILGHESIAPYCKADPDGRPLFRLPGRPGQAVPFLGYASGAYIARLVELVIKQSESELLLDPQYETDMAEGLKAMALEGHGVAFLPSSAVRRELRNRRLVLAAPEGQLSVTMEIRLYREKPEHVRHPKPAVQELWSHLKAKLSRPA